jgi:putative intracellular protease/amidase
VKSLLLAVTLALLASTSTFASDSAGKLTPPKSGTIKVAFVLSEGATVIDFAGPWEVFDNVMLPGHGDDMQASMPFELYTVAPSKDPIHTSGSGRPGMTIVPDYSFADAPAPDLVVVGAQRGGPGLTEWLQKVHGQHAVVMSVCTGAFKVAKAGLFDGSEATTHHAFFGNFESQFPKVKLERSVRYVQASPTVFSAGGLSSGIDLALHIVAEYYGQAVAQKTADYMEYQGTGWKTNQGVSYAVVRAGREEWSGELGAGQVVALHIVHMSDGSYTATSDGAGFTAAKAVIHVDGDDVTIHFDVAGHPADFTGKAGMGGDTIEGSYTQDGRSAPLTLTKKSETSGG